MTDRHTAFIYIFHFCLGLVFTVISEYTLNAPLMCYTPSKKNEYSNVVALQLLGETIPLEILLE